MKNDPRLERYLTALEQVLRPFPVSDRAEIVTEIKSHILSAMEKDANAQLDNVLQALGEPETVANRYLIERGMKPTKPPISPIVKWLVIGFMGTFAMLLIFAGVMIARFSPLLYVDDANDRVSLLGGTIEVDGEEGRVWISGFIGGEDRKFEGSTPVSKDQEVSLNFTNGKFKLDTANDSKLFWKCKARGGESGEMAPQIGTKTVDLDLTDWAWTKCKLSVPKNSKISIMGSNGKLDVDEPQFNLDVSITNGKVKVSPDHRESYRYLMNVVNGSKDSFISSKGKKSYEVSVRLTNGKIIQGD